MVLVFTTLGSATYPPLATFMKLQAHMSSKVTGSCTRSTVSVYVEVTLNRTVLTTVLQCHVNNAHHVGTCQAPLSCHCTGCATFNDLISACDLELSQPLTHVCHRIAVIGSVTPHPASS